MSGKYKEREAKRQQVFASTLHGKTNSLGMFNYTPFSVGDDSMFRRKNLKRDENGKPMTKPRQALAGGNRESKYFQYMGSIAAGCNYIDPRVVNKVLTEKIKQRVSKMKYKNAKHDRPFLGATQPFKRGKSRNLYKHMNDYKVKVLKKKLDENGQKIFGRPQIYTNPAKVGTMNRSIGHLLEKRYPEYMTDPYNRARTMRLKEKMKKSKLCSHDVAFRTAGPGGQENFSNNIQTYMVDKEKFPKKMMKMYKNKVKHEEPWNPNYAQKPGTHTYATLEAYPQYMPDPIRVVKRKKRVEGARSAFRRGSPGARSYRPTPSISLNRRNLIRNSGYRTARR